MRGHWPAVLLVVAGSLAGCTSPSAAGDWSTFSSGPDHLWLAGKTGGRTEFVVYNWTFEGGNASLEWLGRMEAGEMQITVWDPTHDVAFTKSFTRLSPPAFSETTAHHPAGQWQVGVLWAGFVGEYSFEGRAPTA